MTVSAPLDAHEHAQEYYSWSFPGAPVQIRLRLDVVHDLGQRLRGLAADGEPALARGLLLGRISTPGLPEINGFHSLATGDPGELKAALASYQDPGLDLVPVGYFRTANADHLSLGPDDLLLAENFFQDPNCVLLLIQPSAAKPATAGFFFWDRGKMNGGFYDFCFLEFPFEVSSLAAPAPERARPDSQAQTDLVPVKAAPVAVPEASPVWPEARIDSMVAERSPGNLPLHQPAASARRSPPWRAFAVASAAVLLVAAGVSAGIFLPQRLAWIVRLGTATLGPIDLKVQRQGPDLVVTWDHDLPLVAGAASGRLTIYDGATREFLLNKDEMRSGTVVYTPTTHLVRVQFELVAPDQRTTSESVIVSLPGAPAAAAPAATAGASQ